MATRKETARRKMLLTEEIRQARSEGRLAPNEMVPPVRALAEKYGLSKRVVNQELHLLAREGILYTVPRRGVFVRPPRLTTPEATRSKGNFLDDTVVILTRDEGRLPPHHQQEGWQDHVTLGALRDIKRRGYHALMLHPERFCGEVVERLVTARPLGVIFTDMTDGPQATRHAETLRKQGVDVVVCEDAPELAAFDRVFSDHEAGTYQLTRWLIAQGCRRILNVRPGPTMGYWYQRRQAGYEKAMRESGLELLPGLEVTNPDELIFQDHPQEVAEGLAAQLRAYLCGPHAADAILAASDGQVFDLSAACRKVGRQPNEDILIGGYDNYWADLAPFSPAPCRPAATVDKHNETIGGKLVELLVEQNQNHRLYPARHHEMSGILPRRHIVSPHLIVTEGD